MAGVSERSCWRKGRFGVSAIVLSLVVTAAGCGARPQPSTPAPSRPQSSSPPSPACPEPAPHPSCADIGWLDRLDHVRITRIAHGHFGESQLHIDLRLLGEELIGVATITYREYPDRPVRTASRAVSLRRELMAGRLQDLLAQVRRSPLVERRLVVSDSSQTVTLAVDVRTRGDDGHVRHVQFYADEGHTEPQAWRVRGCPNEPPHQARIESQRIVRDLLKVLRRDELRSEVGLNPSSP